MTFGGGFANDEFVRDFTIRFALCNQRSDLAFARGQSAEFFLHDLTRRERRRGRKRCQGLLQEIIAQRRFPDVICQVLNNRSG